MVRKFISFQVIIISCLLMVNFVSALEISDNKNRVPQNQNQNQNKNQNQGQDKEKSCFNYYSLNSVGINIGLNATTYKEDQLIEFSGTIENKNSYPVVDGNILVRISKKNENFKTDGNLVIEEFFANKTPIAIDSEATKNITFDWKVPKNISAGDYEVNYFFTIGKKFNLGGLSFSYEVVAGNSYFNIDSNEKGSVMFDPSKTTINGKSYNQIGNAPFIKKESKVTIKQTLVNSTNKEQDVVLVQELYFWDSLKKEDLKKTRRTNVKIPANSSKEVTFLISNIKQSVSFVKMTATYENKKSITWVRFASNINTPRINYPAITKFPIKAGEEAELFSCFHNTSLANTKGEIIVTLTDKQGNVISNIEHKGVITSDMDVISEKFKSKNNLDYVKVSAVMKNSNGVIVDRYSTIYDCEEIGCKVNNNLLPEVLQGKSTTSLMVIVGLAISFFSVIMVLLIKSKKNN